jgi:hypothetical protein
MISQVHAATRPSFNPSPSVPASFGPTHSQWSTTPNRLGTAVTDPHAPIRDGTPRQPCRTRAPAFCIGDRAGQRPPAASVRYGSLALYVVVVALVPLGTEQ